MAQQEIFLRSESGAGDAYSHPSDTWSYQMDCRRQFDWHPVCTCCVYEAMHRGEFARTNDPQEWAATSVLHRRADADT